MQDWAQYSKVAERFQRKVPYQDREDLRHSIILAFAEQAERNKRNGNKPLTEFGMYRIASHTVADYWRAERRQPQISLNTEIEDSDGNTTELIDTIADDNAINLEAWVDARTWLWGCPKRLIQIAHKRVKGEALSEYDRLYLHRWRKREQKRLL